jgi:hypothetical protein
MGEQLNKHEIIEERIESGPIHKEIQPPAQHELLEAHASGEKAAEKARESIAEMDITDGNELLEDMDAEPVEPVTSFNPVKHIDQALKYVSRNQQLKNIQGNLSPRQKTLSKVIHQKAISTISEGASKTVTRPSGLLGGGILAFAGTLAYYYISRHAGLKFNYTIYVALFIIGFAVGIVGEIAIRIALHKRKLVNR